MDDIPIGILLLLLFFLIIVSGFFSGSETGLMALNRYRLRHLARDRHAGALRASRLLEKPDRLLGLLLLGNNFVNILISVLTTILSFRLFYEPDPFLVTMFLTVIMVLFAEVTPKTLAAVRPEQFAFPATLLLVPLMKISTPFVWLLNLFTTGMFRLLRIEMREDRMTLSQEELRTVVLEAGSMIPRSHQNMLLGILDLEQVTVNDIMVPRGDIIGIDIDNDWSNVLEQIYSAQHTRLPLYRGDINRIVGIIHLRRIMKLLTQNNLTAETLLATAQDIYFVPENTPLHKQLLNFQKKRRRVGIVVDEYGEVQGLVTLEDILEEIVGEFTTDPMTSIKEVHPQEDGTWVVDGTANIRELNKLLGWRLPTDGPKTLNGLILEHLQDIPEQGTSLMINGYPMEIIQAGDSVVKTAKIYPVMPDK
ncbi:MAG: HlyC/CorC family transporter, partial [Granulosicoccaceae bacterium]